jgi:hypothetical protein
MKTVIVVLLLSVVWNGARAQSYEDSLRYAESVWSVHKKAMFMDMIPLENASKTSFWSLYEGYASATRYLEIEYFVLMKKYGTSVDNSSDVIPRLLRIDMEMARVRKYYYKRIKRALSPEVASHFMFADNYFRLHLRDRMHAIDFHIDKLDENLYTRR